MKPMPQIEKYMTLLPCTVDSHFSLVEAEAIMNEKDIRHLPVIKDGELVGIISDRDLKLAMQFPVPSDTIVEHVMVRDLYIVDSGAPIDEVALTMAKNKYGSAIVRSSAGILVGIFTSIDALQILGETFQKLYSEKAA